MVTQRIARLDDCEAVTALQRTFSMITPPSDEAARARWHHLWVDNPAARLGRELPPMGWVLEAEGRIVGFFGNVARIYRWQERWLLVGVANQWSIEKPYRTHTNLLSSAYMTQSHSDMVLVSTANHAAGKLWLRAGATPLPNESYQRVMFWVLNPASVVEAGLARKEVPAALARMIAVAASPLMTIEGTLRRRPRRNAQRGLEIDTTSITGVSAEVDELFERKVAERPCMFVSRRVEDLVWNFTAAPHLGKITLITCRKSGRLEGYLVLRRQEVAGTSLVRGQIMDVLIANDEPAVFDALLSAALDVARAQDCHLVELIGLSEALREHARNIRPFIREFPTFPYYFLTRPATDRLPLQQQDSWYPAFSDGDSCL